MKVRLVFLWQSTAPLLVGTRSMSHAQHISELFELNTTVAKAVFHGVSILDTTFLIKAPPDLFPQFTCVQQIT